MAVLSGSLLPEMKRRDPVNLQIYECARSAYDGRYADHPGGRVSAPSQHLASDSPSPGQSSSFSRQVLPICQQVFGQQTGKST
jgi:hypothetical protein